MIECNILQRIFDIIFCAVAIVLLSPLYVLILVILRLTGEGEIFYFQERVGRNLKVFKVIKFATMLKNSPKLGTGSITVINDKRVLPFGKFLRKTKINELPQLLNILKGEMSLIGPRPLTQDQFNCYPTDLAKNIKSVRPGLSGGGSIVFRDEEKLMISSIDVKEFYRDIIAPYKGELEAWYVRENSLFIYFALIYVTFVVVLRPNSNLFWRLFPDAPKPTNKSLQRLIGLT
ncbi:sugar transferase [Amylibacter sp.]|nr:sugar transferase [Amylibacter sp.]